MDNITILALGIVGPGLVASGIVLYRKSIRASFRALGAAFIADGLHAY